MKKGLIVFVSFIFLSACNKYQVVSELKVNLYHLHSPKNGKIEIIVTEDKLQVGEWYRLKQIDIIEIDNEKK